MKLKELTPEMYSELVDKFGDSEMLSYSMPVLSKHVCDCPWGVFWDYELISKSRVLQEWLKENNYYE